jgi:hypothetical protein
MTVGGVDTYYDYDEHQWKFRRLGGGPVHQVPVCPAVPQTVETEAPQPEEARVPATTTRVRPWRSRSRDRVPADESDAPAGP